MDDAKRVCSKGNWCVNWLRVLSSVEKEVEGVQICDLGSDGVGSRRAADALCCVVERMRDAACVIMESLKLKGNLG